MEESLKFNSQVCTTKEQSQRLLDLGLKAETADMYISMMKVYIGKPNVDDIPAWSLHRLIEIAEVSVEVSGLFVRISSTYYYEEKDNVYDNLIDAISELINNEVFNKEYLKL